MIFKITIQRVITLNTFEFKMKNKCVSLGLILRMKIFNSKYTCDDENSHCDFMNIIAYS